LIVLEDKIVFREDRTDIKSRLAYAIFLPLRGYLTYKHLGRYHELVMREFYPTPNMTAVICKAPTNYELGWKNVTEPLVIEGK